MRRGTALAAASAAGVAVLMAIWYVASNPAQPPALELRVPQPVPRAPAAMTPVASSVSVAPVTADDVARWSADATGGDAAKRATAITALGAAPRAQALPVLRRILINGEPQVDRPLALRSLRDLALNQGDADGAIRDAVRQAIYHGDDQTRTDEVQEVLDIIEESEHR